MRIFKLALMLLCFLPIAAHSVPRHIADYEIHPAMEWSSLVALEVILTIYADS